MFEFETAVQSINYMIRKSGAASLSKLEVLKLVFLADRYHLRTYGRSITDDEYWAMTYGPVASSVKDIVSFNTFLSTEERAYIDLFLEQPAIDQVASITNINADLLSETDIEALDKVLELRVTKSDLVDFTHYFPEWKKHEAEMRHNHSRAKMSIIDFFDKAPDSVEYTEIDPEVLELNKEHYLESLTISQCFSQID